MLLRLTHYTGDTCLINWAHVADVRLVTDPRAAEKGAKSKINFTALEAWVYVRETLEDIADLVEAHEARQDRRAMMAATYKHTVEVRGRLGIAYSPPIGRGISQWVETGEWPGESEVT